jgi:hypothetical protein
MSNPFDQYDSPAAGANPFDRYDAPAKPTRAGNGKSTARGLLEGAALGVSDIGNTVLNAMSYLPGKVTDAIREALPAEHRKRVPDIAQMTRTRNADFEALTEENKDSTAFKVGRVGANIAATLPVGGALGAGVRGAAPALARAGVSAPLAEALASSLASGGFRVGSQALPRGAGLAVRMAGGGATGAASAGLVNPDDAGTGAAIGALLPPGLAAVGSAGRYAGRSAKALVQPLTEAGQKELAAKVIREFGEGGPMNVDLTELVAGSRPTLAEATGNSGIAGLQRVVRDLKSQPFVDRAELNAAARDAAFSRVAGDRAAIESAKGARDTAADALYGRAFTADSMRQALANESQKMRAPFSGVGLSGAREDLATPGLRELIQRPTFRAAAESAKRLAANNGVQLADPLQSLEGLHYIKLALDDALNPGAASAMGRNESRAIMGMRDKLAEELAKVSPTYGAARQTFAEMSQPINAMEALQDLKLTDQRGNITLQKVKTAIEGLERARREPGVNAAKSITDEQLSALRAIQLDLLRQDKLGLGKSAGSNTMQNLGVNNLLATLLPGKTGAAINGKIGTSMAQAGRLVYSGADEKIRNNLVDFMLDPSLMPAARGGPTPAQLQAKAILDLLGPAAYRAAPVVGTSR